MSLKFINAQDIVAFQNAVFANSNDPPEAGGGSTGTGAFSGFTTSGQPQTMVYHQGRDRYYCVCRISSLGSSGEGIAYFDPFLVNDSPPESDHIGDSLAGINVFHLSLDQFNEAVGKQRIFTANSGAGGDTQEVDEVTLAISAAIFTAGPNGNFKQSASDIATSSDGGWNALHPLSVFFTGLTDGIPNETLQQGANVYPDGLYLAPMNAGQLESDNVRLQFGWVDIRTRRLEGLLGVADVTVSRVPIAFPYEVDSSPTGNAGEALIGGDTFDWVCAQFIADGDSMFEAPKGQLLFHNRLEIPAITSPSPGDQLRNYVRLTDFNPFGVAAAAGETSRTHGRVRLTSRIVLDVAPIFDIAGEEDFINPASINGIQFDQLRQRFVVGPIYSGQAGDFGRANSVAIGFYSPQPSVSIVTAPAARDVPRTNDIVDFETFAGGDLGEAIAGVDVTWTLARRSTEGEVLDASIFPGTSIVDNFPIDDTNPSTPEGTLVVVADGTTLVETTDYTVALATGVITWVTDQSGAALVTATYEHRAVDADPAHGTLLTSRSQTDENGNARTQVLWPDNDALVGKLDLLDVDET